jgi:pSer/pThr/pTyr-binding forkhead associated (FHA) protein
MRSRIGLQSVPQENAGRILPRLIPINGIVPGERALDRDEISVGSAADNNLVISGGSVSRHHALVVRTADGYRVNDLASTNGTFVNGRKVLDSAALNFGDEIRFAGARFVLRDGVSASEVPPSPRRRISSTKLVAAVIAAAFATSFGVAEFLLNNGGPSQGAGRSATAPVPDLSPAAAASPDSAQPAQQPVSSSTVAPDGSAAPPTVAPDGSSAPATADWLEPLNRYRAMAGLDPVAADPKLSQGDYLHSRYLVKNYAEDIRNGVNLGIKMHTEEAGNRWYTADGLVAATNGDVDEMWDPHGAPPVSWAIDNWIQVPFHRMTILNPELHRVGYGTYCDGPVCVASLNVITDADPLPSVPKPLAKPVQFPPDGASLRGWNFSGEWPDPLTACPGYDGNAGMPITLQLGAMFAPPISHYALTLNGASVEACGFDSNTYSSPDPAIQDRGRLGLKDFGGVVLIPRASLAPGTYSVSIATADHTYTWSFTITP